MLCQTIICLQKLVGREVHRVIHFFWLSMVYHCLPFYAARKFSSIVLRQSNRLYNLCHEQHVESCNVASCRGLNFSKSSLQQLYIILHRMDRP